MKAETLARLESRVRPVVVRSPWKWSVVFAYSHGRKYFLKKFSEEKPERREVPEDLSSVCWGIRFRSPIFNAAGMFKHGESYDVVEAQGAGAYLGGTDTWNSRDGNLIKRIRTPFASFPLSRVSLNSIGLQNPGTEAGSQKAAEIEKKEGCPVGWSFMGDPSIKDGEERQEFLVRSMWKYEPSIDFAEANLSCPNTGEKRAGLAELGAQTRFIRDNFISKLERKLPVIAKLSVDWPVSDVNETMDILFQNGFSGVNFGNTSTDYAACIPRMDPRERALFTYFSKNMKGGIGGALLKEKSLVLSANAAWYVKKGPPVQEFHVIRTAGIEEWGDIRRSMNEGVSLHGWFTGYWDRFVREGHDVYKNLYKESETIDLIGIRLGN